MEHIAQYRNGNADIELYKDGTRIIQFEDKLQLDYPLNIDIRVSTKCSNGYNPKTGKSVCAFCHESARVDGKECDYEQLKEKLTGLPKGIELAIGGNEITVGLWNFLRWSKHQGYVCNVTVNQINIKSKIIRYLIEIGLINGLGISYRKDYPLNINEYFINHPNVALHVIAGIDDVDDVIATPFKKVLVLGYKNFGFGIDYHTEEVDKNIQRWYWWIKKLIDAKDVVSFDNLALEQLNIKRFLTPEKWDEFNQGEHSFYINAVDGYFAPSSRSGEKTDWNEMTIPEYFKLIDKEQLCGHQH